MTQYLEKKQLLTFLCISHLQIRVNRLSELLQTLVCFRLEVLKDVLKVVFLTEI